MTLASPLRLTLLGTLFGLHLAAQAAPAPIVFDTTPRAGQHQRQLIELQTRMNMRVEAGPDATDEQRAKAEQAAERVRQMGPMKMSMRMQQTLKVDQPDAQGWLPLTVGVTSQGGSMEVGGKVNQMPAPAANMSYTARFNPQDFNFEMQKMEGVAPEMAEALRTQGSAMINETLQLFKALAQRPLKIGDSVEVPMTMALPVPMPGGAGNMQGNVVYTLKRVDRGVAHFDLGMTLSMNIEAPLPRPPQAPQAASAASAASAAASGASAPEAAAPAAPQTMKMQITGSGKGNSSLRLADRLPLSTDLAMDMKMTMNGPDNGRMLMDMDMVVKSKGENLAKPAAKAAAPKKKS